MLCGPSVCFDVSMAGHSSFRTGGRTAALVDLQNREQLLNLLRYCTVDDIPWRVIGRGSNILVEDRGFDGILFRLGGEFARIRQATEMGSTGIIVGGGCSLAELLKWGVENELGGMEFMVGIPGSVGGAVRMNAGAHNHSIAELLDSVTIAHGDGTPLEKRSDQLNFGYRSCRIGDHKMEGVIILEVGLRLHKVDSYQSKKTMRAYLSQRKRKQPLTVASAGSFFKNPEGDSAGRLIEAAGLKGACVGGAMVSPQHANFIVNSDGTATASDIIDLMHKVREKVVVQTGILLEPEVHIF